MKMEYNFYMFAPITPQDFVEYVRNIFTNKLERQVSCPEDSENICILSEYLQVWVNIDQQDPYLVDYCEDIYGFKANIFCYICIGRTYKKELEKLFTVFRYIIHELPYEFLFTDDVHIILGRRNKIITGYSSSYYGSIFPYHLLNTNVDVTIDTSQGACHQTHRLKQLGGLKENKITDISLLEKVLYNYEYSLWVNAKETSPENFVKSLRHKVSSHMGKDIKFDNSNGDAVIFTETFSIMIHLGSFSWAETSKRGYGFQSNFFLRVMVYSETRQKGMEDLFSVFREIIHKSSDEFIFTGQYGKMILEKRNHILTGCNPKEYLFTYPFHILESEVKMVEDE